MENLSVSPSRFDDVGIILNGNNCFVGLETPDGVEACTLDKPFVLNKKRCFRAMTKPAII